MEKSPKIPKIYKCDICCYSTRNKKDISKHYDTIKHKNATNRTDSNEKIPNEPVEYHCQNCDKSYKAKSSLWYHLKKCTTMKTEIAEEKNSEDYQVITELLKQNQDLQKQIIELSKERKQYITNTTNNTKTFNLNVFLNETCKDAINLMDFVNSLQLKLSDFENTGRLGYVEGISKIIVNGLKQMDVHKRPIHCTDTKRETMYVKDQNVWEKENSDKTRLTKAVKMIADKNLQQTQEWIKTHPDCAVNNTPENENFVNIMLAVLGGQTEEEDNKNREKILRNIAREVSIDK
jgi:hypothetical protein